MYFFKLYNNCFASCLFTWSVIKSTPGKGWARIKSVEYSFKTGEFLIIPIHEGHKYAANESDPWTIYWIHFKGSHASHIVELIHKKLDGHKGFLHYADDRITIFNDMYEQLERGYSSDNLAYVNMCRWYFLASFIFHDKFKPHTIIPVQDTTNNAIDFMGRKIDQLTTLEEIAKFVNLSSSHFSTMFKKKTGFTPIEYFNHLKIQKACQYLLFSDLRVKEIAFKLGIEDPYYFSRLFSKVMGVSPNDYREKKIH